MSTHTFVVEIVVSQALTDRMARDRLRTVLADGLESDPHMVIHDIKEAWKWIEKQR